MNGSLSEVLHTWPWNMDEDFQRRWPLIYAAIMAGDGREAKIQRLIDDPGATEGERAAAVLALERLRAANSHE